jgi:hypothetical protein
MSNTFRRLWRHPAARVAAAVLVIVVALAAYWFQPWKLVTKTTVDEPFPTAATQIMPSAPVSAAPPSTPVVVAEGALISHEHATSGTVKLVQLPNGSRVLRVENLDTSDGPQLVVLLSDAPVIDGRDGWHVFEQGRHVDLGALKGNRGSANYPVPAGIDLKGLNSVSIWCDRFDVSFGAATLIGLPQAAKV